MRALFVAFALSVFALPARAADCTPIPGADVLWAGNSTRFIFVGEQHGTREAPEIFGDLVCAAGASKRPIVVAIEHLVTEQPALDAFMRSSGDTHAIQALLADPFWSGFEDGRESVAYLGLIERLRTLKAEGRVEKLVAIDPGSGVRDRGMALRILGAGLGLKNPLTLIYAGNFHTAKYPPMPDVDWGAASYLPESETISLVVADKGGTVWNCQQSCGVHDQGVSSTVPRGIMLGHAWLGGHDGTLAIGTEVHASPPARDKAT